MEHIPKLISTIPQHATFMEYFDSLNCFDKRTFINEFKTLLFLEQKAIRQSLGYLVTSLFLGVLSLCYYFNPWFLLILLAANAPCMYFISQSYRYANKLHWIVRYLENRLI